MGCDTDYNLCISNILFIKKGEQMKEQVQKAKDYAIRANQTTVMSTGIGGAIAFVVVLFLPDFGIQLDTTKSTALVAALTTIFNFFIPKKEK